MRTTEEIITRAKDAQSRDPLGFEWQEYLRVLPYAAIRPFLKPEAPESLPQYEPETLTDIECQAKTYLSFWLEKIEGERGISVCRATSHYTAWKWLLGHPDADMFPGSIDGSDGGWYQRTAYEYIKAQIDSGEWDRLTEAAKGQQS